MYVDLAIQLYTCQTIEPIIYWALGTLVIRFTRARLKNLCPHLWTVEPRHPNQKGVKVDTRPSRWIRLQFFCYAYRPSILPRRIFVTASSNFKIFSAAYSAATTIMADGLPVTMPGKMEPSTTKRLSVP